MRGSTTATTLLAILVVACTPDRPDTPATQEMASEADVAAISAVSAAEIAAIVAGDMDALAALLADDAVYMPPMEPAVSGKAAIRSWTEAFLAEASVDGGYPSSEIDVVGDWAIERYTLDVTMTPVAGGEPTPEMGKGIHIYRRGADGSWKLTYDIWNWDNPPPEM